MADRRNTTRVWHGVAEADLHRYQSCSRWSSIRSARDLSRAWRSREETSPDSPASSTNWPGNGWTRSRKLRSTFRQVVVINHSENVTGAGYVNALESAAPAVGVQLIVRHVRDVAEIEQAVATTARQSHSAIIMLPSPLGLVNREMIIKLAAQHRLPAVYPFRYYVASGGLMSYGADTVDVFRRSASYIDRILRGEKPAALPVQQPTKFDLTINVRTAKALGLDVPQTLLARADEVIE